MILADIRKAAEALGVELAPWQVELAQGILAGG